MRAAIITRPVTQLADRVRGRISERVARWARRRQGADALPVTLAARRIYILPTRAGAGFAALLLAMLVTGLNYGNNLALFLTFLLGGFALVAMHQCHRILLGLRIRSCGAQAVFAGDSAWVDVVVDNPAALPKAGLQLHVHIAGRSLRRTGTVHGELAPGCSGALRTAVPTRHRGRLLLQRAEIATQAPFGLFRAWSWLHVPLELIVYPRPAGRRAPPQQAGEHQGERLAGPGDDEWIDLRAFRQGDSPRQVAWKAYARGAPLLVREYRALGAQTRMFDLTQLRGLPLEDGLAQLARWVVDAEARGERYGLRLPGERIETGNGLAHRHRCLAALALHDLETDAAP